MSQSQVLTIAQALYWAAKDHPGGATGIAAIYGLNPIVLGNSLNPNNMQHKPNLKHFAAVLESTRDARILNAVGQLADGLFIPVGKYEEIAGDDAILDNMLKIIESIGDYGRVVRKSIEDGNVNNGEWFELQNAALEGIKAIHMVLHNCSQLRGEC
jgi:hypothetical protein